MPRHTVLYYTILYYTTLHYTTLCYTIQYHTIQYITLHHNISGKKIRLRHSWDERICAAPGLPSPPVLPLRLQCYLLRRSHRRLSHVIGSVTMTAFSSNLRKKEVSGLSRKLRSLAGSRWATRLIFRHLTRTSKRPLPHSEPQPNNLTDAAFRSSIST